jgi:hypothetical protein
VLVDVPPVELGQGLAHHGELGLAVTFENLGIALPKHERDEVVCNPAGAQARGKRVSELGQGEIWDFRPTESAGTSAVSVRSERRLSAVSVNCVASSVKHQAMVAVLSTTKMVNHFRDILIALEAAKNGAILVTENARDFLRCQKLLRSTGRDLRLFDLRRIHST